MIVHTLVFSFGDTRTPDEIDAFLERIGEICLGSGMARSYASARHRPAAEDDRAPVFVSSAIAQLTADDLPTLERLSEHPPLLSYVIAEQERAPYRYVWVNSDPLRLDD